MSKLLETFGKNLKHYRGQLSQQELSKLSGVHIEVIRRAEQSRGLPALENIEQLAQSLNIDPTSLFYPGKPPEVPEPVRFKHDPREAFAVVADILYAMRKKKADDPLFLELMKQILKERL